MRAKARSTHQIIEEQMQRWQIMRSEEKIGREVVSVIRQLDKNNHPKQSVLLPPRWSILP